MPRLSPKSLLFSAVALAALSQGAALHAQESTPPACYVFDLDNLRETATDADIIVSAEVVSADGRVAVLRPAFYLKGSASPGDIDVHSDAVTGDGCELAPIESGTRVVAVLQEGSNGLAWPGPTQVFALRDGIAANTASPPVELTEAELINRIRDVTGQYAVPPAAGEDSASIDWLTTVVPLVVALLIVLGIGLYLMRIWHRIDPS